MDFSGRSPRNAAARKEARRCDFEAVKRAWEVLVVSPEGVIDYLNDLVQPFKRGVVDIGIQAAVEGRRTRPDWTAYLVPMALKYRYRWPIGAILERRTRSMERRLCRRRQGDSLPRRLVHIVAELLHRQEMLHHLMPDPDRLVELGGRVQVVRWAALAQLEGHYADAADNSQAQTMDRRWRLSSYVPNLFKQGRCAGAATRAGFLDDLAALGHVSQMGSWQPQYVDLDPSQERLAEMVLKLEREEYGIKRPRRLANRESFLRIGDLIDLAGFVPSFFEEPQVVCHRVAEHLRDVIQALINAIPTPLARGE